MTKVLKVDTNRISVKMSRRTALFGAPPVGGL
jgi:hypothetical protein